MLHLKRAVMKAMPSLVAVRRHREQHGRFPNILRPKSFNEKVLHRIMFDRRNILTQIADKYAVRSYVEERLGSLILPELYYVTTRPETIPFDRLPQKFVVKPTHGSGWIKFVIDKQSVNRAELIGTCRNWLSQNWYDKTKEWAYKEIVPRILVEQFIDDGNGHPPNDYKLFVFGGTVKLIQVDTDRFTDHRRRLYDAAWRKLDVRYGYEDIATDLPPPVHLAEMISAAETLGKGLDFVRADFYDTSNRLYFGELTGTPECGLVPFIPGEFDRYVGGFWKLPSWRQSVFAMLARSAPSPSATSFPVDAPR